MKKIIIIEDDPKVQQIYQNAFHNAGYEASCFRDVRSGFIGVKDSKPDLILLDIMLPGGMNGFDLLELIKKEPTLKSIPVIVITNLDSEKKVAEDIGASAYFVKANTTVNDLTAKVKELIGV